MAFYGLPSHPNYSKFLSQSPFLTEFKAFISQLSSHMITPAAVPIGPCECPRPIIHKFSDDLEYHLSCWVMLCLGLLADYFVWIIELAHSTQWLECLFVGEWHLLINSLTVFVRSSHHQVNRFVCLLTKFSPFEQFLIKFLDIRIFAFSIIVLQSRNWLTHNEPS